MTQDHSSKLSFSIEESVWLNKGQEVDEIISLSLDPEITVQEQGEYVLIRGGLKLTGEYRSNNNATSSEETESLASQVAFRSIEEVTLNEDGTGEIRHHFPIDVTIPQERIRSLDDIFVIVDSFDYDLPERGCIQLTADISITGMASGTTKRDAVEELNSSEEEERTFHFEAYNQEQAEEVETVVAFPSGEAEETVEVERVEEEQEVVLEQVEEAEIVLEANEAAQEVRSSDGVELTDQEVETERERAEEAALESVSEEVVEEVETVEEVPAAAVEVKEVKMPAIAFGVIKDRPKDSTESNASGEPVAKSEGFSLSKSFSTTRRQEVKQQKQSEVRKDTEASEHEETQVVEAKTPREENALYLTKMLTKGEGEQFKKLKICIIRENETLETIAARYEITQSTLIRVNRLNDSNVTEGQILYIPVTQ
ncbi:stage VI sporulation protein D [Anaerobacillus alkaliphilus]|uniref:Stage VI sporulation protein D n=1 Tax=Anaerobacillus alkaliphilus TaxID=1548597 RepID=A0A4Q0VR68_9BACI|nr:stage VI sporulation protein D [Anaerobacillus alkaliphilus]RXI98437.1 stage VI sporulation protein D [Anaerobacillus alkaliphilus]